MRDSINRLQFRHNDTVFESNIEAIKAFVEWNSTTQTDASVDSLSLLGEPTILRYKNEYNPNDPHIILAIGSNTNEVTGPYAERLNGYCFIDVHDLRKKIHDHYEEFKHAIAKVNTEAIDSDTLDLFAQTTDSGTVISGDVKIAKYHTFDGMDGRLAYNSLFSIATGDTADKNGLFAYVDVDFDERKNEIVFQISNWDGSLKTKRVALPTKYIKDGEYKVEDESLHLYYNDDSEPLVIDLKYLLDEWEADNGSTTPIMLKKEIVEYDDSTHVNPYKDVLSADIRLKDDVMGEDGRWHRPADSTNILNRTEDDYGQRALYVDGVASNIIYYTDGVKSNVQDKLDELSKLKISNDSNNIITEKIDGFFASSKLEYNSNTNTLVFKVSGRNDSGQTIEKSTELQLNTVNLFTSVWYDSLKEELVLEWVDDEGKTHYTRIPIGQMIEEWEPQNEGHSVTLVRARHISGKDKVSADVNITKTQPNNILQDINHELYVNGIASNIKYDITGDTNVKQKIDELRADLITETNEREANDQFLSGSIDSVSAITDTNIERIDKTIGTGFTDDQHTNITAKFEELTSDLVNEVQRASDNENAISGKLDTEIARSISKDDEHDAGIADINTRIGAGFSVTSTVRNEIDALSANTLSSIKDITSNNDSLTIVKSVGNDPTVDLEVNIYPKSGNTIAHIVNGDDKGLFNFVDLTYDSEHNKLTFKKSLSDGSISVLPIQLESISFIDTIYYDAATEELVIIYYSGHERKEVRIPLRQLIDEWDVYNDAHSAVKLTKEWNSGLTKNILSAEVIVSDNADNILENIEGALFVSNSGITANTAAIAAEAQRATARENEIEGHLNDEIARAKGTEANLQAAITDETSRAISEEQRIEGKVNTESARSIAEDTKIENTIGTAFTESADNNVTFKFNTLSGKLDTEIQNRIDDVDAEETRAIGIENGLRSDLNSEITNRQIDVDAEEARAKDVELELTNKIGTGFTTADTNNVTAKFNALSGAINQEITDRIADVDAEEARAITAENQLTNNITAEQNRATAAETALSGKIDSDVTAERNRALSAETELQTAINNEKTARENADSTLAANLGNEVTRATSQENIISGLVVTEKSRAENAESVLTTNLNAEKAARENTDTDLQGQITAEVTRAMSAETDLNTAITSANTRIGAEETARANADSNLQSEINAEKNRALAAESALRDSIDGITMEFVDSNTIDFTKSTAATGSNITADVKVPTSDNIIVVDQGIKANVNLTYNGTNNTLTFTKTSSTGDVTSDIQLNAGSIIDEIRYDSGTKELVIRYHSSSSTAETITRVPVSDMFNEWDVDNSSTNSAIRLIKTAATTAGGVDKISGNVILSSLSSNILTIDSNGLYVDGSDIANNSSAIATLRTDLSNETSARTTSIETLTNRISAEETARTDADTNLQAQITAETTRAQGAETNLQTAISGETVRAQGIEADLRNAISAETANRITDVNRIENALNNEVTARTASDTNLQNAITTESTNRTNADTSLQRAIEAETARATTAETALDDRIDNLSNSITAITGDVSSLTTQVNTNTSDIALLKTSATTNASSIASERTRATNAEAALTQSINNISTSIGNAKFTVNINSGSPTTSTTIYSPATGDKTLSFNIPTSMQHLSEYSSGTYNVNGNLILTGNLTASSIYQSSDSNLKENITDADSSKKEIANKIAIKQFNFKDNPNKDKVYGVIAQEAEAVGLYEVVNTNEQGYKSVDYTSLMMLKIGYLEDENKALKAQLADVLKRLENLEK